VDRLKAVVAEQPGLPSSEETEQITGQLQHVLQELAVSRAKLSQIEQSEGKPSITKEVSPDVKAITAIAQDLRRPMASILGYTDLLLGETAGDLSPTQEEFLTHVRESTVIMTSMLNDLVHVTAIETGTLDLIPVPVDFLKVIDNSVDQTSTALRKKKVALRMDFPNIMPTVLGDEDALLQIVVHLLNNAIGVSPEEGEIAIVVRRTSMESDQFLTLMIVDQGGGIPPEDISRVFDPVYKTEGLTIIGTSESGMGLSIVRALMEAMGGRVWADSKLGSGTTFTALIPLAGASS
jgi:signal transduction histidine kinase